MSTIDNYPLVLAAECLWREGQNQTDDAMLGIAWNFRNRITPEHDLVAVITQKNQYSSMTHVGDPNLVKWAGSNDAAFIRCCHAVDAVFLENVPDPTGGAFFYFSPPLTEPPADWGPVELTVKIDELSFFKKA